MSSQATRERAVLAYVVGILGSFLIVGALAWAIYRYTQPAPLGEDRAAFRAKNLTELRSAEHEALDTNRDIRSALARLDGPRRCATNVRSGSGIIV